MAARTSNAKPQASLPRGRRLSIVGANNRVRKRRDGTPEKSATPSQDLDESSISARDVIWNEDIEKLQIKTEDLSKHWSPKPPSSEKTQVSKNISVRKIKKLEEPKASVVSIARPAPSDAPLKPMDYSSFAGPRYDEQGDVIPHSLLGNYEDFYKEAVRRGDLLENVPLPQEHLERAETPSLKHEKKKCHKQPSHSDSKALRNWQNWMIERKRQQGYISKLLQKAPEQLAMNQADNYRAVQEERYLIERTIPKVDYGKGYRLGSEFWHQAERFGDDLTGLHLTLTQVQRGYPPPIEHVGLSKIVKKEKGCPWLGKDNVHFNYAWHKSEFLNQRKKQLQPFIDEIDPWKPDFDELQVTGSSKPYTGKLGNKEEAADYDANPKSHYDLNKETPLTDMTDTTSKAEESAQNARVPTVERNEPVFGPSLLFGGQPARWAGDSFSLKDKVGAETRVSFEAFTGDCVTSYLELINDGTTSIYYDWKKMAKENPFDLIQKVVQRFYFNNSPGVILPGDIMKIPFAFKSPNAGVFTEQWKLESRPVVCNGAALLVTLRGVALQEDKFKNQREQLEKELLQKEARKIVSELLQELVSGIRTPPRSQSPIDAYLTEEEIFSRNNLGLQYNHRLVAQLKELYGQLFDEHVRAENVWSLSVPDLQESILKLEDDEEKQESLLHQLSVIVGNLGFLTEKPVENNLYQVGYQLFQETIDMIASASFLLRHRMGLPAKDQADIDGNSPHLGLTSRFTSGSNISPTKKHSVTSKSGYSRKGSRGADSRGRTDTGKDKAKGPIRDGGKAAAKGPTSKSEAKGKTTPSPSSKKTPTPQIVTQGDKDETETGTSYPSTPDQSANEALRDSELAAAKKLYRDTFTVQVYNILGEMLEKMDSVFHSLKGHDIQMIVH